ncbi:MAG: phosphonate ABC transporter ATP-binding protein [Alphaproteobacteria bacterium]
MTEAVRVSRLRKTFRGGKVALDGVSLSVLPGEMIALIGASGSGKSTLLRHIAGLAVADKADGTGEIAVLGRSVQKGGRLARDIRALRGRIGFVFQQFNLVERLTVETNVLAGMLIRVPLWRSLLRWFTAAEKRVAQEALARVGIRECCPQRAGTLSGGQQQRAAIARALVQKAEVILADEPIASLDPESSRRVMETLARINREDGITVLVSLHQVGYATRYCPRVVALKDGRIVFDGPSAAITPTLLSEIYGSEIDAIGDEEFSAGSARPAPQAVPAFAGLSLAEARA